MRGQQDRLAFERFNVAVASGRSSVRGCSCRLTGDNMHELRAQERDRLAMGGLSVRSRRPSTSATLRLSYMAGAPASKLGA